MSDETTKREETPTRTGNTAALREALAELLEWCEVHTNACSMRVAPVKDDEEKVWAARDRAMWLARYALTSTPRNCDVGTAEEQDLRFASFCDARENCTWCPVRAKWPAKPKSCATIWENMPYEAPATPETGGEG